MIVDSQNPPHYNYLLRGWGDRLGITNKITKLVSWSLSTNRVKDRRIHCYHEFQSSPLTSPPLTHRHRRMLMTSPFKCIWYMRTLQKPEKEFNHDTIWWRSSSLHIITKSCLAVPSDTNFMKACSLFVLEKAQKETFETIEN